MQTHRLFKKALLALAIGGVLSASLVLIPDSITQSSSAYAKDGGCLLYTSPSPRDS